ncbi:MAG: hypothetical protein ABH845_02915, partial [Candidatus Omnitrophota bacterium]
PYVAALPEDTLFLIASGSPLPAESVLVKRFEERHIRNDFVSVPYLRYRLTNDRASRVKALLEKNTGAAVNTDLRPRGYYYNFLYWVSVFHLRFAKVLAIVGKIPLGFVILGFLFCILMPRAFLGRRALAGTAMAAGGFSLMSAEIILIYGYQVFYGDLYYKIAWIIAAFMAGMALGTWFAGRRPVQAEELTLGWLHAGAAFYFLLLAGLFRVLPQKLIQPAGLGEGFFLAAALLIGGLVGFEFPCAVRFFLAENRSGEPKTGTIYAADLLGSSFGALVSAGFLIPVYGIFKTLFLLEVLNLALCGLLFFGKNLGRKHV